ncbi:hypothetical protein HAX54_019179 [Datura stramonium]|uniref:Uncharacterized protein n=1 Tax=Datura stramonium TaxID=4076 RepID=A0ABS8UQP4_DATST|nr:hypothetical protein [Datura stramonium]
MTYLVTSNSVEIWTSLLRTTERVQRPFRKRVTTRHVGCWKESPRNIPLEAVVTANHYSESNLRNFHSLIPHSFSNHAAEFFFSISLKAQDLGFLSRSFKVQVLVGDFIKPGMWDFNKDLLSSLCQIHQNPGADSLEKYVLGFQSMYDFSHVFHEFQGPHGCAIYAYDFPLKLMIYVYDMIGA